MFGPYRIPYIDSLYFWDSNVDHRVGRAMMARNFSNISAGVLKQVCLYACYMLHCSCQFGCTRPLLIACVHVVWRQQHFPAERSCACYPAVYVAGVCSGPGGLWVVSFGAFCVFQNVQRREASHGGS
jgi:hypothetical protein